VSSFFLQPTVEALGVAGQPFMEHLMNRRKLGIVFQISSRRSPSSAARFSTGAPPLDCS